MSLSIVILAAGLGKRMHSDTPKVLHPLAGKPLLEHVIQTARALSSEILIVHGHQGEKLKAVLAHYPLKWVPQAEQLGTGHAVLQCLDQIPDQNRVLILYGDVPLISSQSLERLIQETAPNHLGLISASVDNPSGLGRILRDASGKIRAIIEEKEASTEEKNIREINSGIYVAPAKLLKACLPQLKNYNAQKEYYLTDMIVAAVHAGIEIQSFEASSPAEILGVNDRLQLAQLERAYQLQMANKLLQAGVTLIDPTRFDLRGELNHGRDVSIDINVIIEGRVRIGNRSSIGANCILRNVIIGNDVEIKANSILDGAEIADFCQVGPFARLRPGTELARESHIGNFVEVKNSQIGSHTKINHLSYIGDSEIGEHVNIGAGTITCNYDGINKHRTTIGDHAFIGSNSQLVAPVTIGTGATIGAGSTITRNAPAHQLTIGRAIQRSIEHWKRPEKKDPNMCGIVGAVAKRRIEKVLVDGLKRLEYRGYDSAGIALLDSHHKIQRLRTLGKVKQLESTLQESGIQGYAGIAHTRWATHGIPAEHNAHPFISHDLALVHNGIIENHDHLRLKLISEGYEFTSETDSETVVHLLHWHMQKADDFLKAVNATVAELQGAYALGIFSAKHPDHLIAVRHGSPLVIGKSLSENFIASDPLALLSQTQQFIYLEDQDIADITSDNFQIYSKNRAVERKLHQIDIPIDNTERGSHRHYMSKEIAEQPKAIADSLEGRIDKSSVLSSAFGITSTEIFRELKQIHLIACGTSYHAALVARYWLEALAGVTCSVEVASEYRYRESVVLENTLFVCLSQSGETADTLAALRLAKQKPYAARLAICNVPESSLVREADYAFMTRAGIEIGVASTKAFTTQLVALLLLTLSIGKLHALEPSKEKEIVKALHQLPNQIDTILRLEPAIAKLARLFADKHHTLFLGRGALYPVALEGALKLKEISYIHAEAYPAGELKHGPLALVDKEMPVIAIAPQDALLEKLKSNLHEVKARGGELFVFTDEPFAISGHQLPSHCIKMPSVHPVLHPIAYTIPLQLLAYHVAIIKGTDVDQPRNLAKSVTVE